jgi:hypothetical protein
MSSSSTVTSLGFSSIFPKDTTLPSIKKYSNIATLDNPNMYVDYYFEAKRKYKSKFKKSFLKKNNFYFDTSLKKKIVDKVKLLDYIKNNYDTNALDILNIDFGANKLIEQFRFYAQNQGYDIKNKDRKIKIGGTTYDKLDIGFTVSDDPDDPNYFKIIDFELSNTNGDTLNDQFNNDFLEYSVYVKYSLNNSSDWKQYIVHYDDIKHLITYSGSVDLDPVIPLKVENKIRVEDKTIKRALKKYGLKSEDFLEQLKEQDNNNKDVINTALMMTGIEIVNIYKIKPGTYEKKFVGFLSPELLDKADESTDGKKITFTQKVCDWWWNKNKIKNSKYLSYIVDLLLDYYTPGKHTVTWNDDDSSNSIKMTYDINYTKTIVNGVLLGSVHKGKVYSGYTELNNNKLKKQISETQYIQLDSLSIKQLFNISGEWFEFQNDGSWKSSSDENAFCGVDVSSWYSGCSKLDDAWSYDLNMTYKEFQEKCKKGIYNCNKKSKFFEPTICGGNYLGEYSCKCPSEYYVFPERFKDKCQLTFPRLVIPLDSIHTNIKLYSILKEYGTVLLLYAEQETEKNIIKTILSLGVAIVGCIMFVAGCTVVSAIVDFAIAMLINYTISIVAEMLDFGFLSALIQIVKLAYGMYTGQISIADPAQFLPQAINVANAVSNYIKIQHYKDMAEELKKEKEKEAISNIDKMIDEYDNMDISKVLYKDSSRKVENDNPDTFYYKTTEILYNYDIYFGYTEILDQKVK